MKFKSILVDDEPFAIENLKLALALYPSIEIVGEATNPSDARLLIDDLRPDVVFLDIDLNTHTGFDLLESLSFRNFQLIFVTAHAEHALKAFEYSASNYILKPIQSSDLNRVVSQLSPPDLKDHSEALENLTKLLAESQEASSGVKDKITLPTAKGMVIRQIDEIAYLQASGNYTMLHFDDESKLLLSKTMKEMEQQFSEYYFFRIHHRWLINCHKVKHYDKASGVVELSTQDEFSVSHRRRTRFLRFISGEV